MQINQDNHYKQPHQEPAALEDEEKVKVQQDKQQKTDMEIKEEEELQEMSQPFWFSNFINKYPIHLLSACCTFMLFVVGIVFLAGFFKMSDGSPSDFYVWSDTKVQRSDAYELAKEDYTKEIEKSAPPLERTINQDYYQTFYVYKRKKGDSLLTTDNLNHMLQVEKHVTTLNNNMYQDFCLTSINNQAQCDTPFSLPLIIAKGDYNKKITDQELDQFLQQLSVDETLQNQVLFLFDKDFHPQNNPKAKYIRSIYKFGFPLEGYNETIDEDKKQQDKFDKYNRKVFNYIEDNQNTSTVKVTFFNQRAIDDYAQVQIKKDILFAMVSCFFVGVYMAIHTRSVAVAICGAILMLVTFPIGFFIYRLIFQITFFAPLHTSVLFLLMGIGADDVFVYFDAWEQAGNIESLKGNMIGRISFTARRASMAMFITSSTTVISFLATAISKIMPIQTYGIFAALNIATNFVLVITYFPAFLIVREKVRVWWANRRSKVGKEDEQKQKQPEIPEISQQKQEIQVNKQIEIQEKSPAAVVVNTEQPLNYQQQQQSEENQQQQNQEVKEDQELGKSQKFFKYKWNKIIEQGKYVIILLFIGLIIFSTWGVFQLSLPTEPPSMAKPSHFLKKTMKNLFDDFPAGDDGNSIEVSLIWGLKKVDSSDADYYDPSDKGKVVYDNDFDVSPPENQLRILKICSDLRKDQYKELVQDRHEAVTCFMETFKKYIESKSKGFPVPQNEFTSSLSEFLKSPAGYLTQQDQQVGLFEGKVKYIAISVIGNEDNQGARQKLEKLFDKYEQIMSDFKKNSPVGLQKGFQESSTWNWMVSEKALLDGAVQGIAISLSLAYIILILSTKNILISTYAIFSIIGVILGVIMIIWARGWEFGTFESMNSIIIIGLSVDYVVHLANAYVENVKETRYERTREMLTIMGVSVLGGGCTTLGAGLFLFGGQLMFFEVMGILVSATIGFSLIYALIFFPAVCHLIGPSNNTGNLKPYFQKIKQFICKSKILQNKGKKDQKKADIN